jgi:sporulation protein YlmC with PRC-barrel domain
MLQLGLTLKGYAIMASDGRIGAVNDLLFDDVTWKIRWLVIDTGDWLPGRKVLVHPSAIGTADNEQQELSVNLTKAQIEGSPTVFDDQPVSQQMQLHLYDYYQWDPSWGGSYFGASPNAIAAPFSTPPLFGGAERDEAGLEPATEGGDPHLRSLGVVTGYHVKASDGEIGHVEDFLVDETSWDIRYVLIDTKNWWPGQHVLLSPFAVQDVSWSEEQIQVNVTGDQVKASPPWTTLEAINQAYEVGLHKHYGWPGYGWF